ncbi:MAG: diguanylate cyclase [Solirubrobacteraceae bacterium]|nr:diguanylate cyclase [Solirubrobacteraceae bacterium]
MSFRNRLTLFFVLIVIVPMLAVTFLLFRLIDESERGQTAAAIAQQHSTASQLFGEQRRLAAAALAEVAGGSGTPAIEDFRSALQDGRRGRARAQAAAQRIIAGQRELPVSSRRIERIVVVRGREVIVQAGVRTAIAPAIAPVQSRSRRDLGDLALSVTDAPTYAKRVRTLTTESDRTGLHVVVLNGSRILGSTLPTVDIEALEAARNEPLTIDDVDYRVRSFSDAGAFTNQNVRVFTLGSLAGNAGSASDNRTFAAAILLGFLLLALACAMLVSRTLQREIAGFLTAARKLAAGDFSAQVPTTGRDEFAALGEEFNKMSGELERRLAELSQERGRVQSSMRRLGEAVASNLDRDALLELVVRTAVDGVGADAGRACVRVNGSGSLEERSRVGNLNGFETALQSVETEALSSGSARETTHGATTAIAHPLRGADALHEVVGVVSVARNGRFTAGDRELFSYLAGQVARSMENVELHETTARRSVTDELTGLSNRRAFDDALAAEVERAKRFGTDLGLVLIDIDDFKRVNDTYGHPQGDVVLREVARVLRDSSREVDHPARYGGEELAAVLPGTDLEGAFQRAERIREEIAQLRIPRLDGSGSLSVTASCGVAIARGTSADSRGLVQAADSALYVAKRSGKNKSVRAR